MIDGLHSFADAHIWQPNGNLANPFACADTYARVSGAREAIADFDQRWLPGKQEELRRVGEELVALAKQYHCEDRLPAELRQG
ncbi:MAG: hypothetical protein HY735_07180 [Verrucomicrobia bacterium]|nr:hypothetical protein [Verrucomicrobiota bacterium]